MNAFAHVFDPHSSYFSPRNSEEYRIQMSLSYEGIGASLQLVDDYVTVMEILPGGSAQQSGELKANDRIIAVGQGKDGELVDVVGWRLDDVVQLIRGPGRLVRAAADPAGQGGARARPRRTRRAAARQDHARGAGREEGTARRSSAATRKLRIGVITVPSFYQDFNARSCRRRGLPQHDARRAQA